MWYVSVRRVNLNGCRCSGMRRGFRGVDLDCRRCDGMRWGVVGLNGDTSRRASHRDADVAVAGRTPCAFLSVSPNLYPFLYTSLDSFLKRMSPDNTECRIRRGVLCEADEALD